MENITLIGMPSAGKTYLGKRLATKYDMGWVDLDTASYSKTIRDGGTEEDYMKKEESVLLGAKGENNVFGCSGSSIYSARGMDHLKKMSMIVYLRLPLSVIEKRLSDFSNRGVVKSKSMSLKKLYKTRCRLYEKYTDYIVDCEKDSIEGQFKKLCQFVEYNKS